MTEPPPENPQPIPALRGDERIAAVWAILPHNESPEPDTDHDHVLPEDVWARVRQGAGDPEADRYPGDADRAEDGQWPTS